MRIVTTLLALAIVMGASASVTSADAGWIGDSIRSQKPQCPPKKKASIAPTSSTKKQQNNK